MVQDGRCRGLVQPTPRKDISRRLVVWIRCWSSRRIRFTIYPEPRVCWSRWKDWFHLDGILDHFGDLCLLLPARAQGVSSSTKLLGFQLIAFRRSLEELDYMFEARIPTRQFGKFDSTAMMEEKRRQHHTNVEDVREEPEKMVEGDAQYTV